MTTLATRALAALAHRGGWPLRLLAMAGVAAFYALTVAGNTSEPDDADYFALRAERVPVTQVDDPRLMGYHLLARGLWLVGRALGLSVSGMQVLHGLSLVAAVIGLWLVWRLLSRALALPREAALLGTAALGLSYGFWRYAVEGDVYVPAIALCTGVLLMLMPPRRAAPSPGRLLAAGVLGGLAVLVYQPNTIPLFMAFPLLVWRRQGFGAMLLYVGAGVLTAGTGYLAGFVTYWPQPWTLHAFAQFLAQRSGEFAVAPLSLRTVLASSVRSAIALGHDLLSSNAAWGLPPTQALAARVFGSYEVQEEIFAAQRLGRWAWACGATLGAVVVTAVMAWRAGGVGLRERWALLGRWGFAPMLGLWLLLTAGVIGRLNPGGIEAWIVVLLPLWLLLSAVLLAPACRAGRPGIALALVLAIGLHNGAAGMAVVRDPAGDLLARRIAWLVEHAGPKDLIIVSGDLPMADRLRYRSRATVMMVLPMYSVPLAEDLLAGRDSHVMSVGRHYAGIDVGDLARQVRAAGGRVLVHGRFFEMSPGWRSMSPDTAAAIDRLRDAAPLLHDDPVGGSVRQLSGPAR